LLKWRIWWVPNNTSKWQMGFNSAFKGLNISRSVLLRISCRNKSKHTFYVQQSFIRKSCQLWGNVPKYFTARQVTDDNMAHVYWMLDTYYCKHTFIICNNYCFCVANMVARTPHCWVKRPFFSLIRYEFDEHKYWTIITIDVSNQQDATNSVYWSF